MKIPLVLNTDTAGLRGHAEQTGSLEKDRDQETSLQNPPEELDLGAGLEKLTEFFVNKAGRTDQAPRPAKATRNGMLRSEFLAEGGRILFSHIIRRFKPIFFQTILEG